MNQALSIDPYAAIELDEDFQPSAFSHQSEVVGAIRRAGFNKLPDRRAQRKQSSLVSPVRIVFFGFVALACQAVRAECYIDPSTGQRFCTSPNVAPTVVPPSAHCRITVGDGAAGSGTLVARDVATGTVLTCSHLFDGSASNIVVAFPSGERFAARLIERDQAHDLAALLIRCPKSEAAGVASDGEEPAGMLTACGYGSDGQFRCVRGEVTGRAMPTGASYPAYTIRGSVRPGDSGGGVLDAAGRVVGVVWGERDGLTYATCGQAVRDFLRRLVRQEVRGKRQEPEEESRGSRDESREPEEESRGSRGESREPEGKSRGARGERQEPEGNQVVGSSSCPQVDWKAWLGVIESRLKTLDEKKQDKGEYLQAGDLNSLRSVLHERIEERVGQVLPLVEAKISEQSPGALAGLSVGKLVVGALGLSGPVAAAVVVGVALMGRRARSRVEGRVSRASNAPALNPSPSTLDSRPIAVDTPPAPQRIVPETHYVPVEVDSFAKAHQWASEQVARKYPGATEMLQTQGSLIKQFLAGK